MRVEDVPFRAQSRTQPPDQHSMCCTDASHRKSAVKHRNSIAVDSAGLNAHVSLCVPEDPVHGRSDSFHAKQGWGKGRRGV